MADAFDFTGKVVLITGSSRGIGAGMARAFGKRGARCIVNYVEDPQGRNRADAAQIAAEIPDARVIQCDVSDAPQVARMMEEIRETSGGLDILVNNAGILRDKTIRKMTPDDFNAVIQVNLNGTFNCIHQAASLLRQGGRVVNLSSVTGQLGFFGQANYASSKAGVMALTKVAAREFARQQITVNAIAPGFIDTEMSRTMPPDVANRMLEQIPLGRIGQIDDIAGAVMFLCSPYANYITGQILHVNGGFHMQ